MLVTGGTVTVNAGGDGLKSDNEEDPALGSITIAGGTIRITKSYEGIETTAISITGGTVSLVSSDDGINATGTTPTFTMSGGTVILVATSDGVDVNGSATMSGGLLVVNGPTANNNGALDYDSTFTLTGDTLIATGSMSMAQTPATSSTQASISVALSSAAAANAVVTVRTTTADELATFTPAKAFQPIVVSPPTIVNGTSCDVYASGTKVAAATATTANAATGMGGAGGRPAR